MKFAGGNHAEQNGMLHDSNPTEKLNKTWISTTESAVLVGISVIIKGIMVRMSQSYDREMSDTMRTNERTYGRMEK